MQKVELSFEETLVKIGKEARECFEKSSLYKSLLVSTDDASRDIWSILRAFETYVKLNQRECQARVYRVLVNVDVLSTQAECQSNVLAYDVCISEPTFTENSGAEYALFRELKRFIFDSQLHFCFTCRTGKKWYAVNFQSRKIVGLNFVRMGTPKFLQETIDSSNLSDKRLQVEEVGAWNVAVLFPNDANASISEFMNLYSVLYGAVLERTAQGDTAFFDFPLLSSRISTESKIFLFPRRSITIRTSTTTGHNDRSRAYTVHGDYQRFQRLQYLRVYAVQNPTLIQGITYIIHKMQELIFEKVLTTYTIHILWLYFLIHVKRLLRYISPCCAQEYLDKMGELKMDQKVILNEDDDRFIGLLITDFFKFYTKTFDFAKHVVTLRKVKVFKNWRKSDGCYLMLIEDPLSGESLLPFLGEDAFERI